ncbi:regulator of microtubule dynamics protein 1 [Nilaparvata lugens]|uniref:regulator of microtubule dynamics protein 1 n=1 Tax=Nilaparvata lugens TaxID=108931 RepID=UPI00193DD65C|nr:regulator of microtubule dynamics protein 1 [Nilaparvata lugens]
MRNNRLFNFVFSLINRKIYPSPAITRASFQIVSKKITPYFFHTYKYGRIPILLSFLSLGSKDDRATKRKNAITESDIIFAADKFLEVCELLSEFKHEDDVEILWRLARALYKLSCEKDVKKTEKEKLVREAYNFLERALELDVNHFAVHKWMSVLLDARSELDGIKVRISNLEKVKQHMLEAVKLNPKDATTFYMLGSWCFQIANMPWYQKQIASTIFAKPPESSFEEALEYFRKAEEIQPNFYNQNLFMLGQTYMKLGDKDEAKRFLTQAVNYKVTTEDDRKAKMDAENLLKKLVEELFTSL